ncbi:WD repeat-containing protein 90-like [Plakobranchus ocellatus]|uniref:WD repeat-containing protein 90-like n=1 Tax=Plakobranchus ocellatus TaxID=259542 RepID=A0AAV4BW50_9GAST|nr:WD repeat-containing protein 90-like [Plakobranchus ocellatus]
MTLHDIEEQSIDIGILEIAGGPEAVLPFKQTFPRSKTAASAKSISPRSDDIDALSSIHGGSDADEAFPTTKSKPEGKAPIVIPSTDRENSYGSVSAHADRHSILIINKASKAIDSSRMGAGDSQAWGYPFDINDSKGRGQGDSFNNGIRGRGQGDSCSNGVRGKGQGTRHHQASKSRQNLDSFTEPTVFTHYKPRLKIHGLAKRRYTAPPNQAGLSLKSVIGYNCNGRNNMVWYPDTGFFAYTAGCIIVVEDLNTGEQKYLQGHTEEVSCLALQHDCQVLVSASPAHQQDSPCHICVWDTHTQVCRRVLSRHQHSVQCMAFSRDDRFLVSVGDYRECVVVVWDTKSFEPVASSAAVVAPVHCLQWDPFTVNEFVTVGDSGTVLFWLLDDSGRGSDGDVKSRGGASSEGGCCLSVHEAELPWELTGNGKHPASAFTSLAYSEDSTVFVGTETGKVLAWDTRHNTCFMHWEADTSEITKLVSRHSRLMTAGRSSHALRLWAVGSIADMKDNCEDANDATSVRSRRHNDNGRHSGLTMEDEMTLDGAVTCAQFDDMLDMGIVGTDAGTLWYINWAERTSIRLVSGHRSKINGAVFTENNLLLSGGDDGSVRVWSTKNREQALQFQVLDQSCTCLASGPFLPASTSIEARQLGGASEHSIIPLVVGGYSDGTVRLFDITKVEMLLKMHPHAVAVAAIVFSADGAMILSGGNDGLIAVSSPTTGMTVRVISDHKGVAISGMDVTMTKGIDVGVTAPTLWLSCSMDRRISVWTADWSKDYCELVDWLSFPAPAVMPDGSRIKKNDTSHYHQLPPTLAKFSPDDADTIVYCGYGMDKAVHFYSLTQRKVVRTVSLTHWGLCLDVSPDSSLISVGISERLLKLLDYHEGSFQDFTGHSGAVSLTRFSPSGASLLTTSHNEIFIWELML